jgi:hypothetical protein
LTGNNVERTFLAARLNGLGAGRDG